MLKESNISKLNMLSSILLIAIFSLIILYISIYHQTKEFEFDMQKTRNDYFKFQKDILKTRVDEIVEYINYEKSKNLNCSKEEIQKSVIDRVSHIRFNGSGYFFILDDMANVLFHPFIEINTNVLNLQDLSGKYFIKEFLQVKEDGYVSYKWRKLKTQEISEKITYIKKIKEFNWVIGAGIYMDEIEKEIEKKRQISKERIDSQIKLFLILSLVFIIFSIFISLFFSNAIKAILKKYKFKVETKERELSKLNKSLEESVNEKTIELIKLNKTLEMRVKEEVEKNREKDRVMFQQSRLAQMGEMIGNIAHQWRQPLHELSLILESFQIAFMQNSLNEKFIDDRLKNGEEVIKKMSEVINDFRNFFNPNREKSLFIIDKAINGSLAMIHASFKNNSIEIIKDLKEAKVCGYQNEFEQVILNILSNAKDILLTKKSDRVVYLNSYIKDENYVLKIYDSGGGIKDEIIDKIFNPYFTTKAQGKGTGIGLYMSKVIMDSMNGDLKIENKNFKVDNRDFFGACFIIELPIKE